MLIAAHSGVACRRDLGANLSYGVVAEHLQERQNISTPVNSIAVCR